MHGQAVVLQGALHSLHLTIGPKALAIYRLPDYDGPLDVPRIHVLDQSISSRGDRSIAHSDKKNHCGKLGSIFVPAILVLLAQLEPACLGTFARSFWFHSLALEMKVGLVLLLRFEPSDY